MGNIIDRVIVSANCVTEADITVADKPHDFVQMTDHQAVLATLFMKPPENISGAPNIPINAAGGIQLPRVKYPSKKDKDKFVVFRQRVDEKVQEKGLAQRPILLATL
jgi:hypothetical protein